jgi:hypothetical protein
MKVELKWERNSHTVVYDLTDAPDVKVAYLVDVTIRPETVRVYDDGEKITSVSFEGPRVKKDGTTGATRHDATFRIYSGFEGPDWALEILGLHAAKYEVGI